MSEQQVEAGLGRATNLVSRLVDLDWAGRAMATSVRAHMCEIAATMGVADYFAKFYGDVAQEFIQLDDEDFAIHHCLRVLYPEWVNRSATIDTLLRPEGATSMSLRFGELSAQDRAPIADVWADVVRSNLRRGVAPSRPSANEILPASSCQLRDRPDLFWGQFLVGIGKIWAQQLVILWDLVWTLQGAHTTLLNAVDIPDRASFGGLLDTWKDYLQRCKDYHAHHFETVQIHDAIFATYYEESRRWRHSYGSKHESWRILDVMKYELYIEVFSELDGLQPSEGSRLPRPTYWRRTPWTPDVIRPGAPGMPPFRGTSR